MEHRGSWAISKKSPGVASLPIVRNHMQNKEQEDTSCYIFFFSPRTTDFTVNCVWLFYLLNGVHFLRIFSGLGCPRVSWPVARLPAHLLLKDTVTLNTSKDSGKIVVPRGCLPSGALLITPVLNWE